MRAWLGLALALVAGGRGAADPLDDLFLRYRADTPGCAVGVARSGQPAILRGYGSADLEHAVPITPDTVFEAGSVSKQFTAAAILLLAADGKLALTDDIRTYLPEMPAYAAPVTVDMLLNHTSGLRDWGEVVGIAGWPRGSRVYSHDEVLMVAARQRSLNYPPGVAWSYTNTGYNLAAIIVQRVSGKTLAQFTAERLFTPLGMTHTGWRDDFRNIVPGRAQAYDRADGRYVLDMPFENVHGNSSLLTTVGDLLIWNQALAWGKLGPVGDRLREPATLKDGRRIDYARGLFIQTYRGVAEIDHSGSTAGYRAWLARYADGLSVAMLCNSGDAEVAVGRRIADLYLTGAQPPPRPAPAPNPPAADAATLARTGVYLEDGPPNLVRLAADAGRLKLQGGPLLEPAAEPGAFRVGANPATGPGEVRFRPDGALQVRAPDGGTRVFLRKDPPGGDLAALAGRYASDEAGAVLIARVSGDRLVLTPADRPSAPVALGAAFRDGFTAPGVVVRILRDKSGKPVGLSYASGRVWDLRFRKIA